MLLEESQFGLKSKNYLITGAASGIGRSTSIILSSLGANLILVDINKKGLDETRHSCKSSDAIQLIDLTKPSEIKEKVVAAVSSFGKLDGIIHVAGMPYIAPLKSINEEKCSEVYTLNTYSAIELAKVFINRNVYAGNGGSIIFISSVYGLVGSAANVGYAMSKSALHGVTKSLAIELAPKNIRVNCVAPGFIKTKMLGSTESMFNDGHNELLNKLHPLGLGEPEDVGNAIAFLLSDAGRWITGTILNVDGGYTAQ